MKRLASILVLLSGVFLLSMRPPSPSSYLIGDKAEDFNLQSTDGVMVSLASYPDVKGYLVVFTCNHCPYSQLYEQRIINLHKKFAPLGVPVVAINPNSPEIVPEDSFDNMKKRAEEKRYPFNYLQDREQAVYQKFGATRTPHVFLLDKDLYVRYIGAIDDNAEAPNLVKKRYVEDAVAALLNDDYPDVEFTRAIGCTIKKKMVAK
ncbi:MAG: thioredoxin family protein [Lewinellaceae bacterium]|nr:thioredoxin family protein [Lewinellaceae bacterium]